LGEQQLLKIDDLFSQLVAFGVRLVLVARRETRVARIPVFELDLVSRFNLQLFHCNAGCYNALMSLPARFWGTAVSHYQVEGEDECDWSAWERAGRTRGGACGRAVDAWARYEEDADLAREAGSNAFRFSISWSRIERKPGQFDDAALGRYRRLVDHLNAI